MSYSFSEKFPVVTVLLVSELKTSLYQFMRARTLAASFPDNFYLVSVQPSIPPFYYHIPCIASAWERETIQARKELLSLGAELGLSRERCLLLSQSGLFFKKTRLQRQLVHHLKCPVRLLTLADNDLSLPMSIPASVKSAKRQVTRSKSTKDPVKIRFLARSSVLS